jgi:hypothetical protein
MTMMRVHANPLSLGGVVLFGILLVVSVLTWFAAHGPDHTGIQFGVFAFFLLFILGYLLDAASESLELKNGFVIFDTLIRPKKRVNACAMQDVLIVHEGLNQERGIVSVRFRGPNGEESRIALGPLWRRTDLENFFREVEKETGECKLVEEVR